MISAIYAQVILKLLKGTNVLQEFFRISVQQEKNASLLDLHSFIIRLCN